MRIIKKYENRSLYDAELSSNISVQDLKQYIIDSIPFKVINAKTNEDLTRSYLIQIILELEGTGAPLFSKESLEQIIRFYGSPLQSWMQGYLAQSLDAMSQQQAAMQDAVNNISATDFMASLTKLTANNLAVWQQNFMKPPKKSE